MISKLQFTSSHSVVRTLAFRLMLAYLTLPFGTFAQTRVIDSLTSELSTHSHDTTGMLVLIKLANEYSRSDLKKSRTFLYQCLEKANSLKTLYGYSACYSQFVTSFQNTGELDSARKYLTLLQDFAERYKRRDDLANYHMTAGLFYKNSSQFSTALPHMEKALTYLTDPKNKVHAAGQMLNLGNTYSNLGDINKAAYYHLEALREFIALKNKRGESFCLQSLGSDFLKLKRFKEALAYFDRSYKLKVGLADTRGLVAASNGLGNAYFEMKQYEKALDYYERALKSAQALKLQSEESKALYDLGVLQARLQRTDDARQSFNLAMPLARNRGDSLLVSRLNTALSNLSVDANKKQEIEKSLLHRLQASSNAGERNSTADTYLDLADHYAKTNQADKAYEYLKKFHQLSDSIRGTEVSLKIAELDQRYQHDRSQTEIALLKKDQQLTQATIARQRADQQIVTAVLIAVVALATLVIHFLRTRNRAKRAREIEAIRNGIARDLHDDIGSALSSIHIMSQLALKNESAASNQLQRISESAVRMMEGMSDIVWSINPENDSLERVISRMKEFAEEILEPKNIAYHFEVDPAIIAMKLDVEKRKNLFLIFKESLNNAAKYSEGSEVIVRIQAKNGKVFLTVKDNGKGFELNSARSGNGLSNMAVRAKDVNGKLTHHTIPGKGTEIIAEMPIT